MTLRRKDDLAALVLEGQPPVSVALRRSARARRMTLRVSRLGGEVTLTIPRDLPQAEAQAFAAERADWIRKHVASRVAMVPIAPGAVLPLEGEPHILHAGQGRRVVLEPGHITVPGPDAQIGRRLAAWLKARARDRLAAASDRYATALGRPYTRLTLRDTRSRWGSCSSEGRLMYSWRLILAPAEVLTYVAAHEVAHLAEMNHGSRFWATVEHLYGDCRAPRTWLRQSGGDLHRYRF